MFKNGVDLSGAPVVGGYNKQWLPCKSKKSNEYAEPFKGVVDFIQDNEHFHNKSAWMNHLNPGGGVGEKYIFSISMSDSFC